MMTTRLSELPRAIAMSRVVLYCLVVIIITIIAILFILFDALPEPDPIVL